MPVRRARPSDARRSQGEIGLEQRPDAVSHLHRDLGVDRTLGHQQRHVHAEHARLAVRGIGENSAAEHGRGTGHGNQLGAEQPAGERLGDRDRGTGRTEPGEHLRGDTPGVGALLSSCGWLHAFCSRTIRQARQQ